MKRLRIVKEILNRTHADKILLGFIGFFFLAAFIIWMVEPEFHTFRESIWYCYVAIATIGFGDIVAATFIGRTCTVILSIYSIFVIAVITGVIVNYYIQIIELRKKETLTHLMDKLERLPELNTEELKEISKKVKYFRENMK